MRSLYFPSLKLYKPGGSVLGRIIHRDREVGHKKYTKITWTIIRHMVQGCSDGDISLFDFSGYLDVVICFITKVSLIMTYIFIHLHKSVEQDK